MAIIAIIGNTNMNEVFVVITLSTIEVRLA